MFFLSNLYSFCITNVIPDRHTYRQIDGQTDTDSKTNGRTDRQTDIIKVNKLNRKTLQLTFNPSPPPCACYHYHTELLQVVFWGFQNQFTTWFLYVKRMFKIYCLKQTDRKLYQETDLCY